MQTIIKSVHFTASKKLTKFAENKVEKFERLNNRIVRAYVTLSQEPDSRPDDKSCEIVLSIPGEDPYVKKTAPSFEEAISLASQAMEKVLRRLKPR